MLQGHPGMDSSLGEDAITPRVAKMDPTSDADSAIHSGEDEPSEPQPWACPFCDIPLEDQTATIMQHLRDNHTLTTPQPPTTSPTKYDLNPMEEPRCNISGKKTTECIQTCQPGNHYAGHTMRLKDMIKLENQRGYKWEPHVCGSPTETATPGTPRATHADNYVSPNIPILQPITPGNYNTEAQFKIKSRKSREQQVRLKTRQAKLKMPSKQPANLTRKPKKDLAETETQRRIPVSDTNREPYVENYRDYPNGPHKIQLWITDIRQRNNAHRRLLHSLDPQPCQMEPSRKLV